MSLGTIARRRRTSPIGSKRAFGTEEARVSRPSRPEPAPARCGYGACCKCNCRHYEGNSSCCANSGCGHAYSDHY